jgi:lipase
LVHGDGESAADWQWVLPAFAQSYRVLAPDLPGHGRSPWDPPWTMERCVADVLATMDGIGLSTVDVVGHSFGGALAVWLSRAAPERVRRLVLVDPAVGVHPEVAGQKADATAVPASFGSSDEAVAWLGARWPEADVDVVRAEIAGHLEPGSGAVSGAGAGSDGRLRFRVRTAAAVTFYSELARDAVTPPPSVATLILRAPREKVVRRHFLKLCAAAGSDVTLVDIDCGHMMLEERPVEVLAAVRQFLES